MNRWIGAAIAGLCCLTVSVPAMANVIFQTGFEPPGYTTGTLTNQDGWTYTGSSSIIGTVETANVFAGTQAVEFDATGRTGPYANFHSIPSVSGQSAVVTDEMLVSANDTNVTWEALGVSGDSGFLGQLIVTNGVATLGLQSGTTGSVSVSSGVWHLYTMLFDFAAGTESAYVDSTLIATVDLVSPSTSLAGAYIGINYAGGSATTQAYFDNVSIINKVPEPASLALFVPALLGLAFFYRRKRFFASRS